MTMTSPCMHMDLELIHPRKHMRPGAPTFSNTCVGSVVPTRSLETSGNVERKAGTTALIAPVQINTYSKEKARLKLSMYTKDESMLSIVLSLKTSTYLKACRYVGLDLGSFFLCRVHLRLVKASNCILPRPI